jgi:hypothetical protein
MKALLAAVLLTLSASAAEAPKAKAKAKSSRTAGKVVQAMVKAAPSADGPVMSEGRLTLLDDADHTEEFKITPKTRVTLDGKPAKFQKAAAPGARATRVVYDPDTKVVTALDVKSAPKAEPAAEPKADAK